MESSLLAAHVACFQSVCRKRRDAARRATINLKVSTTANVVVAKVFKARRGFCRRREEEEEEEEEEEGRSP